MSIWEQFKFERKIREILADVSCSREGHHFGQPFLTAYQVAIEFALKYPNEYKEIGMPIGGKDSRENNSLAQYIARELSKKIKSRSINDIEGGFISSHHLKNLVYHNTVETDGKSIESSLIYPETELSMFRLKKDILKTVK